MPDDLELAILTTQFLLIAAEFLYLFGYEPRNLVHVKCSRVSVSGYINFQEFRNIPRTIARADRGRRPVKKYIDGYNGISFYAFYAVNWTPKFNWNTSLESVGSYVSPRLPLAISGFGFLPASKECLHNLTVTAEFLCIMGSQMSLEAAYIWSRPCW